MSFRVCFREHEFTLPPGESIIGRDRICRVRIDDSSVSRRHARLLVMLDNTVTIADLGSKNGVLVNGVKVVGSKALSDEDHVKIGTCEFVLRRNNPYDVPEETRRPDEVEKQYHAPIYRTCMACRALLDREDKVCPNCGAEQVTHAYATVQLWTDPKGRRMANRVGVKIRGLYVSASLTVEGVVSDLSLGGAFFSCELLDAPGTKCDLLIIPGEESDPVRFSAEVVRIEEHAEEEVGGMGMRFVKMTAPTWMWLQSVVEPKDI